MNTFEGQNTGYETTQLQEENEFFNLVDKKISKIVGKGEATEEGFSLFKNQLLNQSNDFQEILSDLINNQSRKIKKYIKENGFPNELTMNHFISFINSKFGDGIVLLNNNKSKKNKQEETNLNEEKTNLNEEETNLNKEKNIEQKRESLKDLNKSLKNRTFISHDLNIFVKEIGNLSSEKIDLLNKEDIDRITNKLKENDNKLLKELLSELKQIDEENGVESSSQYSLYFQVTKDLVKIDSSFSGLIKDFEVSESISITSEPHSKAIFLAALDGDYERVGSELIGEIDDGIYSKVDIEDVPPTRKLSNGKYEIEAELGVGIMNRAIEQYLVDKKSIDEKAKQNNKSLKDSDTKSKLLYEEIKDKEESLAKFPEDTDMLNQHEQLVKNYEQNIEKKEELIVEQKEIKKEYSELDSAYKANLAGLVGAYKKKLDEKDIQKREVLKFIETTGFDMIPQHYTDLLLNEMESGILVPDLGINNFNVNRLDIENMNFGEAESDDDSPDIWKINLIKFMNKIVFGDAEASRELGGLIPEDFISVSGATNDPEEFTQILMQNGLLNNLGGFNIDLARENLKKSSELIKDSSGEHIKSGIPGKYIKTKN